MWMRIYNFSNKKNSSDRGSMGIPWFLCFL
jgi:hypothetical protein